MILYGVLYTVLAVLGIYYAYHLQDEERISKKSVI